MTFAAMKFVRPREQLNASTHDEKREAYHEKLNALFMEMCVENNMDPETLLNMPCFQELVSHLNPEARLPKQLPQQAPPTANEIDPKETFEEYLRRIGAEKKCSTPDTPLEAAAAVERPVINVAPCVLCKTLIQTHQSVLLTVNDATKVLMAAVIAGPMPRQEAENIIKQHPLRMCTEHVDQVHEWMCKTIGASCVSEVESAPVALLLDAVHMYRRIKGVRDIHDGKVPSNTALGSFKMAVKIYFRNYVPRRKQKKAQPPQYVSMQELIKRCPINMPLRDYLREENVLLTPKDERSLLSSIKNPKSRVASRRRREHQSNALQTKHDPLASYIGKAISARSKFVVGREGQKARLQQQLDQISHGGPGGASTTVWPDHLPKSFTIIESSPVAPRAQPYGYDQDSTHEYDPGHLEEREFEEVERKPELFDDGTKEPKEEPMW